MDGLRGAASAYFPSPLCGPTCNLGLWRLANPPASILALSLALKAARPMTADEMK